MKKLLIKTTPFSSKTGSLLQSWLVFIVRMCKMNFFKIGLQKSYIRKYIV